MFSLDPGLQRNDEGGISGFSPRNECTKDLCSENFASVWPHATHSNMTMGVLCIAMLCTAALIFEGLDITFISSGT